MSRHNVLESLYVWLMVVAIISLFGIQGLFNAFMIGILVCLAYLPAYRWLEAGGHATDRPYPLLRLLGIGFVMALLALCILGDEAQGNAMVAAILGYVVARPARLMVNTYLVAED